MRPSLRDRAGGRVGGRTPCFPSRNAAWWLLLPLFAAQLSGACDRRSNESAGDVERWTLEPGVRIGGADGPAFLESVFGVELGADGAVYVGERQPPGVVVFDRDATPLRSIGRRGDGPGELAEPSRLGWLADTLWVLDAGRIELFTPEGEFLYRIRFTDPSPPKLPGPLVPGPPQRNGSVLSMPEFGADQVLSGEVEFLRIYLTSRSGSVQSLVSLLSLENAWVDIRVGGRSWIRRPHPYADNPLWADTPDGNGVVVVERPVFDRRQVGRFRVRRIDIGGDTLFSREYSYPPKPIPTQWSEGLYERLAQRYRAGGNPPAANVEEDVRESLPFPPVYPPVTDLVAGADGSYWLRREDVYADSVDWDVLDDTGHRVGRVRTARQDPIAWASLEEVWLMKRDERGGQRLVGHRVVGARR